MSHRRARYWLITPLLLQACANAGDHSVGGGEGGAQAAGGMTGAAAGGTTGAAGETGATGGATGGGGAVSGTGGAAGSGAGGSGAGGTGTGVGGRGAGGSGVGGSGAAGSGAGGSVTVDPTAACPGGKPAAFPGAQGPGACATGGRVGDVYHVTNLTDDATSPQPGSLRYGISTAPSAGRTIVFDVAGTIITNPPGRAGWMAFTANNLTVAGQTAPEPGITIMGAATKMTGTNVIVRHMHFRPGQDRANPGISTNDGVWIETQNIIVDHLSNSWSDDELLSVTDAAQTVTVQNSLLAEGLEYALVAGIEQGKGHSMGGIIGSDVSDTPIGLYHNLYAHAGTRNPRYGSEVGTGSIDDYAENVVYDWIAQCGYAGPAQVYKGNIRNNYYIAGASTTQMDVVFVGAGLQGSLYFNGNVADMNKNGKLDGTAIGATFVSGAYTNVTTPYNLATGTLDSAQTTLNKVLATAGAFYWARDRVDARIVNEVKTGTGSIPLFPPTADWNALWNATTPIKRPAGFDTDNDGMPDAWEKAHGLNPTDASDAKTVSGGYTNLENYLNAAAVGAGYP